jgi:hypothetical protein
MPMTSETKIIWGCAAIAKAIGRSEKATFHALQQNKIPGAKKVAGRWGLDFSVFVAAFAKDSAA